MSEYYLYVLYSVSGAFGLLMLTAAVYDGARFIIPNPVVVSVAALFLVATVLLPFETSWSSHFGAAVAVFAVGMVVYRFRLLGAGDIKLMTAVGLWAGFEQLPLLLLATAIAGGAVTVALLTVRMLVLGYPVLTSGGSVTLPRAICWGEPIPYGIAIAVASLYLATHSPYLLAYT